MISIERRSSARVAVDCKVGYFHLPPAATTPVFHALNLSMLGVCLEAPSVFEPGSTLSFYLITPDNRVADVNAQVVHSEMANSALYHVGVCFTRLKERDREILTSQYRMEQSGPR